MKVTRLLRSVGSVGVFILAFLQSANIEASPVVSSGSALPKSSPDFILQIKPIFEKHCLYCHDAEKQRGGFRLDRKKLALKGGENHAPAIIPGNSQASPLIHFVTDTVEGMVMPQKGERLNEEEIELLRAWIDGGANWPDDVEEELHWAFQPVNRPAIPVTQNPNWVRNPIDAFILQTLEMKNVLPSPEADRRTLIRRVTFDLTGLPPSPEEVAAFVADDRQDAYERLVERLLSSPRYGERWARHWLDVVRFAETTGFEVNTPRDNAWPYRDYVIQSFNEDKPYDQFVREQLAGDALQADEATGFIVGGPNDQVKSPDIVLTRQQRSDELHDMVATTGSAFLGLTVGCARCHNHKFDPVSQVDYFAITAIFSGVQHGERELKSPDREHRLTEAKELTSHVGVINRELARYAPLADPQFVTTNHSDGPPIEGTSHAQASNSKRLRPAVHPKQNFERFTPVRARFVRFTITDTTGLEPCIDELEIITEEETPRNVALASLGARSMASSVYPNSSIHRLEHLNDGLYGNKHSWISSETGKGWVQVELPEELLISKVIWGRDREEVYSDRLATGYVIEVATNTNAWRVVAGSNDRQRYAAGQNPLDPVSNDDLSTTERAELERLKQNRSELEGKIKDLTKVPMVYAGTFTTPETTYRLQRGDPMQPREVVGPGVLSAIAPVASIPADATDQQRRRALADWIVSPANPLTARVMANRLWQHHFGEGLVSTPSDFGLNGARPSHPALLDWIAAELMDGGWRLKRVHRLMLLSNTYRQDSAMRPEASAIDAGNRLLWRFSPRRLEAEPIRDSLLWVSGKLDLRMGGPGYHVFEPNDNYVRVYEPKKQFGEQEWRRMIYQFKPRMQQDATFGAFDCPDGGQIAPQRNRSTTPLQALNLLNSGFVMQQAQFFADRLEKEASATRERIDRAFLLTFNRGPTVGELTSATRLVEEHGWVALCRALLNANEFLYVF